MEASEHQQAGVEISNANLTASQSMAAINQEPAQLGKAGGKANAAANQNGKQTTKTKGASKASKQVASGAIKKKSVTGGGSGGLGGKGGSGGTREGGSGGGGKGGGGGGKRGPPRTACDRYRQIKMKCDQTRPVCGLCGRNGHTCVWS